MESKLQLKNWGLPQCVLDQYNKIGLESMFQWQAECLSIDGVLDGRNLVYAAPTSAGKTLVVEILLLKRILETGKKALFILPFVSVAREKLFHMRTLFEETGICVDGYMGGHAPTNGFSSVDVAVCTIEKANGLINRLIEEKNIDQIGMLVIDELHMVGDEGRGYILELLLTKIRFMGIKSLTQSSNNTNIQIVGMSATLPNLSLLADWLDAALYVTDFRPVPLQRCLKIGSAIYDDKVNKIRDFVPAFNCKNDDDNLAALCYETLNEGNSVLVFCPTKNWCEKLANNVAHQFYDLNRSHQKDNSLPFVKLDLETLKEIFEQLSQSPVGVDAILNRTLPLGVAYHHAGLTTEERDIVEAGFRIGAIRVLIATSTLSSGVNLPARRVIIRTPTFNRKTLDVRTYLQMTGRAGRKGVDDQGESILICRQNEQTRGKSLLTSRPLPVKSCLIQADNEELTTSMKRAILEIIVNGVASTYKSVMQYTDCTLLSAQLRTQEPKVIKGPMTRRRSSISSPSLKKDSGFNRDVIENCVEWLVEHEFVHFQDGSGGNEVSDSKRHIIATQLGRAALLSSLPTSEALTVLADLHQAMKALALDTELHLIYLVTPIFCYNEWTGLDWYQYLNVYESLSTSHKNAANLIGVTEQFLTRMASGAPTSTRRGKQAEKMQRLLGTHRRFYAALALHDLVQEVPLSNVCSKYSCNRGMLQQLQQSAASFAGMVTTFCQELGWWSLEVLLREFQTRLAFGVQRELMDLMQISLLNSQRARALYTAGLITCQQVSHAEPSHIELVLRNALHFQTNRKAVNESDWEVEERRKQRNIHVTGKRGITEYEAAQLIIDEAKKICGSKQIKDESFMAEKSPQTKKSKTQSSHKDKKLILLTEETSMNIGDNGTIDNVDKVTGNKTLDSDQLNGDSANVESVKSTGESPSNNRTEKVFTEVQTGVIESFKDDQPNINCFQNQLLSREAPISTKESMEKGLSNYEKVSKQLSPISTQHTREMFNKQTTNSQISGATLMPDPNDVSKSSSLVETHRPYKQGLPDFNSTSKTVSQVVDSGSKQGLPDSSYVVKESSITETHKSCKQMLPDSDYSSKTVSQVKTHPSSITSSKQGLQVFVSIAKESSITDTQLQLVLGDDTMNSSFSDSEIKIDTNSAVKEKEDSSKINPNLVTDSVNQNSKMCLNIDIACQDAEKLNENTAKFITNQSKGEDDSISSANLSCSETNNSSILESEDIFAETKFDNSITVLDSVKTDNAVTIVEDSPASCKELELNIEDSMSSDWDQNDLNMNSSLLNNSITLFLSPASSSENQQNKTNSLNLSESSDSESPISLIFDADSSDDLSEEELVDMDVPMFSNCSSGDEMGSKATSDYSGEKHCLDSVCDMKNISSNSEISLKTSLTDSQLDAIMDDSFSQENIAHSSRIPNNENVEIGTKKSVGHRVEAGLGKVKMFSTATFGNSYGFSVTSPTQTISKNDLSKTTQNKNIYQGPAQFSEKKQEPPASQNSGHSVEKRVSNNLVLSPDIIKAMDISDSVIRTPCSFNKNSRRSENLKTEKSFSNLILSPAILKEMDASFSPCNSADNSIIASNTVTGLSKSTNNSNCTKPKPICDRYSNSKYKEANTSSSHAKGSPYVSLRQPTSKEKFSVYNSSNSKPKSALPTSSYAGEASSPHVSLGQPVSSTSTPKSHIHAKVLNQKWKLPLNSFSNAAMSPYVSLGQPVDSKTILEKSKFVKIGSAADVSTVSDNSLEDLFDMTTFGSKSSNTENSKFDSTFSIENLDKAFNFSDLSCNESFSDNITDEKITIPDTKKSTDKNNAVLRKRKSPTVIVSPTQSKSSKIASNCPSTPSNHVTHEQFIEEEQLILSSQKSPINSKRKLKKKHTKARKSIITESKKKIPTSKNEIIETDCKNKKIKMTSLNDITNTQDKDANIMNNISSGLNTGEENGFIASSQTLVPTAAPVTQISQKLTVSQSGLTIIDVCSHTELFNTFMKEWNSKTCFSFAVATRSNETHKPQFKIGVPSSTTTSNQQTEGTEQQNSYSIAGIAVCWEQQDAYYISLESEESEVDATLYQEKPEFTELTPPPVAKKLSVEQRIDAVRSSNCAFQRKNCISGAFCIKKQFRVLRKIVETSNAFWQDPTVAAWMLDPSAKEKTLIGLVNQFIPADSHLLSGLNKCSNFGSISCTSRNDSYAPARIRACAEAICCYRVMKKLKQELKSVDMLDMYSNVEMPHIRSLALMEINGMGFNKEKCSLEITNLHETARQLERKAHKLAKKQFNIGSPTEVAKVLFGDLGLPVNGSDTKTTSVATSTRPGLWRKRGGKIPQSWSTKKEILEKLKKFHPLPEIILHWRQISFTLSKTLHPLVRVSTFCKETKINRIHPECITRSITGRVSVAEPNIQNVPKSFSINIASQETEKHPAIREVCIRNLFIPSKGYVFVAADYSQLEIRIFAHLSGDEKLLRILNTESGDVFKMIAAQWKGIEVDSVSAEERQRAKQICYGMLYGIGAKALSQQLDIDEKSAEQFMESFLRSFPAVKSYIRTLVKECAKKGYVKTLLNRRRYLPSITDTNMSVRSQAERQAVNTTVQGSAADVIKKATVMMHRTMKKKWNIVIGQRSHQRLASSFRHRRHDVTHPGCYLVLHLHDELMFEVRSDILPEVASLVQSCMEKSVKLNVRLPVKLSCGESWGSLKEYIPPKA